MQITGISLFWPRKLESNLGCALGEFDSSKFLAVATTNYMLLTFKTIRRILSQRFIFFSWSASLRGSHAKLKPGGLWPCLPQRCRCSRLNPFKKTKPVPTQLNLDWAWLDHFSIDRSMSSADKIFFQPTERCSHQVRFSTSPQSYLCLALAPCVGW